MKRKRFISITLSLVLMLSLLAGCGTSTTSETTAPAPEAAAPAAEKIKIGVAISDYNDKWLSYMLSGMQNYANTVADVEVIYVDSKGDTNKQLGQVENFIAQDVDAIVVNPVDTDATGPITKKAKEANIPLISVNRIFKNQDEATSYVGSESITAGIMQMEYLAKQMNYKGNVAIMVGDLSNEAAIKRTEGVKQVIAKYPDMKVVAEQSANWQRDQGMTLMENWLQSGMKIDAIASNNDEMAIGAVKALEAAGKQDEILVGGIDATPDALEYLKAGRLDVTVFQDANGQGQSSIETAIKAARGQTVEPYVWIPFELVIPEEVDKYIAKWE